MMRGAGASLTVWRWLLMATCLAAVPGTPASAEPDSPASDQPLRGKVAVITGSSSGLGRALAEQAAERGMKLVLADIDPEPSRELAAAAF